MPNRFIIANKIITESLQEIKNINNDNILQEDLIGNVVSGVKNMRDDIRKRSSEIGIKTAEDNAEEERLNKAKAIKKLGGKTAEENAEAMKRARLAGETNKAIHSDESYVPPPSAMPKEDDGVLTHLRRAVNRTGQAIGVDKSKWDTEAGKEGVQTHLGRAGKKAWDYMTTENPTAGIAAGSGIAAGLGALALAKKLRSTKKATS